MSINPDEQIRASLELQRDLWRECAGKLYDELRVRGVSESVSREGAGCIELFEHLESVAEAYEHLQSTET
jgi:hypothetical protein